MKTDRNLDAITIAVNILGGTRRTAKILNVSEAAVSYWKQGNIPEYALIALEKLTKGRVKRHEMAPTLFDKYSYTEPVDNT
jgi:DNA-binding transcriptional regulator YdaS (Cro superfamily)